MFANFGMSCECGSVQCFPLWVASRNHQNMTAVLLTKRNRKFYKEIDKQWKCEIEAFTSGHIRYIVYDDIACWTLLWSFWTAIENDLYLPSTWTSWHTKVVCRAGCIGGIVAGSIVFIGLVILVVVVIVLLVWMCCCRQKKKWRRNKGYGRSVKNQFRGKWITVDYIFSLLLYSVSDLKRRIHLSMDLYNSIC